MSYIMSVATFFSLELQRQVKLTPPTGTQVRAHQKNKTGFIYLKMILLLFQSLWSELCL